mmetsp:Transcript_6364/g.7873  ORF Transcript_6364/g.7873 Transcript_6364/m.7873 type:complete len:94 (-) Transcript_6364:670-951(-)
MKRSSNTYVDMKQLIQSNAVDMRAHPSYAVNMKRSSNHRGQHEALIQSQAFDTKRSSNHRHSTRSAHSITGSRLEALTPCYLSAVHRKTRHAS